MSLPKKWLIPFTGGLHSVYTLLWALQRDCKVHLFYVTNMFPQNGPEERNVVEQWAEVLHDTAGQTIPLTSFTIPSCDVHQLQEPTQRFAYLLGLCNQMARRTECDALLIHSDALQGIDVSKWQGVKLWSPPAVDALSFLYTVDCEQMNLYEETAARRLLQESGEMALELSQEGSQGSNGSEEVTAYTPPLPLYPREFSMWSHIYCCQRPYREHAKLPHPNSELPYLCTQCQRCRDVMTFVTREVTDYLVSPQYEPDSPPTKRRRIGTSK